MPPCWFAYRVGSVASASPAARGFHLHKNVLRFSIITAGSFLGLMACRSITPTPTAVAEPIATPIPKPPLGDAWNIGPEMA